MSRRSTSPPSKPTSPSSRTRSGRTFRSGSSNPSSSSTAQLAESIAGLVEVNSASTQPLSALSGELQPNSLSQLLACMDENRWRNSSVTMPNNGMNVIEAATGEDAVIVDENVPVDISDGSARAPGKEQRTQSVRDNAQPNSTLNRAALKPTDVNPVTWTSFFTNLPKVAGEYSPRQHFDTVTTNGRFVMPPDVHNVGAEYWADHLVGFFLGKAPPYHVVREQCNKNWRMRGRLFVQHFDSMFYLKFSNPNDKLSTLERDPIIIEGQPFIITPWSVTVGNAREQVTSIPVWATFTNIPSVLQPLIGLDWLASLVGKLRCFDSNTVARKSLNYARALIEISPLKPLPVKLPVTLVEGYDVDVDVRYSWSPDICSKCRSFGHTSDLCKATSENSTKIPLCKPNLQWVPKPRVPPPEPVDAMLPDLREVKSAHVTGYTTVGIGEAEPPDDVCAPDPSSSDMASIVDVSLYSEETFLWNKSEKAWVHGRTEMRHRPGTDNYYIYVGEDKESRYLMYHIVGNEMILATEGVDGLNNVKILSDSTWDRRYLYGPNSPQFVVNLVSHFTRIRMETPPCDAVGD